MPYILRNPEGLGLRKYSKSVAMISAGICLATGVYASMAFKWMNKTESPMCSDMTFCPPAAFRGALIQTQLMFIAEAFALCIYPIDKLMSQKQKKLPVLDFTLSQDELKGPIGVWWHWCLIAGLDFLATLMINTAFQLTFAATVGMLRNLMVVIAAGMQMIIIGKAVRIHEWVGVVLITVAMVLTAIPALLTPEVDTAMSAAAASLGVALAIAGTSIQASMLLLEELAMRKGRFPPMLAVGFEGLGGLAYTTIAAPIYHFTGLENITGGWYQIFASNILIGITAMYVVSALVFNVSGMAVTKLKSGLMRCIIFALRAPGMWLASLAVGWQMYDWFSGFSAIIFIVGLCFYANTVGFHRGSPMDQLMWIPVHIKLFNTQPEKDDPYPYQANADMKLMLSGISDKVEVEEMDVVEIEMGNANDIERWV